MNNLTKWFFAIPFTLITAVLVPAFVAGGAGWFLDHWTDTLFQFLSASMWLAATGFVDVTRPRGAPDRANRLIPLALILAVPLAVWDRTFWVAALMPDWVKIGGVLISMLAVLLGVSSRILLGRSYAPRPTHLAGGDLIQTGPYRWIRHPLYLAALLWVVGWPLTVGSFLGSATALVFVLPAVRRRMSLEEDELLRVYGEEYREYVSSTWRLVPFLY